MQIAMPNTCSSYRFDFTSLVVRLRVFLKSIKNFYCTAAAIVNFAIIDGLKFREDLLCLHWRLGCPGLWSLATEMLILLFQLCLVPTIFVDLILPYFMQCFAMQESNFSTRNE